MRKFQAVANKISLAIAIVLTLSTAAWAQTAPPIRKLPLTDAVIGQNGEEAEGNLWMSWSSDRKLGYVEGLLIGSYWAYNQACTESSLLARSISNLQEDCLSHRPTIRYSSEQYVKLMTEFYSKYPEDRALSMRRLQTKLSEPEMTIDGVHKWLDELIESVRNAK